MTFESREQFLAWRAEWRAKYAQLSKEIRQGKVNLANAFRSNGPSGRIQHTLLRDRALASAMMAQREEIKAARKAQIEEAKAQKAAA